MKKANLFFNPIEGTGPLTLMWHTGPFGDATESNEENGVGYFTPQNELLAIMFDEVCEAKDSQKMSFKNGTTISISVSKGNVEYDLVVKSKTKGKKAC